MGQTKVYTCFQWPFLNIADRVVFKDGFYSTDDEGTQQFIEKNGSFGAQILLRDTPEEIEAAKKVAEILSQERNPVAVIGARSTANQAPRERKEAVV